MTVMSTDNNTTPTTEDKPKWITPAWIPKTWGNICQTAKTAVVLVFIVNSVALGLYGFGLVRPDHTMATVFGAISIAFAAVVLGTFVNNGVKFQSTNKKRK